MKKIMICLFLFFVTGTVYAQEASPLAFVSEFVRELSTIEKIRTTAERESKEKEYNPIMGGIRNSTRIQLELRASIETLTGMHLKQPFDGILENIINLYKKKIEYHQTAIDIASEFTGEPKPNVDYGKLTAEMPTITASLEYIDETLFQATPTVFGALIDMKADSHGHASHLVITKVERQQLIRQINSSFGSKLNKKNQNYTVGSASALRAYLQKDFKCSDEPW